MCSSTLFVNNLKLVKLDTLFIGDILMENLYICDYG
ncbi:hypothetical protein J2W95_001411 [Flavobacterium granuli]|uniref:Uncharacterized protein n=1 Tax=Flavobacterium granuli TaxID=280093 RepID=A0ABU1S106_9FLAO|nr:hypothetical protein [Flavobacterium granuli]